MGEVMARIGIDLRPTAPGFKAHFGRGTGRYATEVASRLFAERYDDVELHKIEAKGLIGGRSGELFLKLAPIGKVTIETQFLLPRKLQRMGVDLLHFFAHGDAPARLRLPYVVTVLDLIPLKFPDLYRANKPNWRFRLARYLELEAIRHAEGILAISECTKRDLVDILGIAPEKVAVTPLGVDPKFKPRPAALSRAEAARTLKLAEHRPLVSYVGGIDPRKNVPFLLEAFAEVLKRYRGPSRPQLALVGRYDGEREYPALLEQITRLGLREDVRLLGYLSDDKLLALYHASTVVAFPSLYEGFGLPVLEAMACGVPVVAARNSSLPEISGDAALLLPDHDLSAWVSAIDSLLEDTALAEQLASSGIAQAQRFSWNETSRLTLEAYRRVLGLPTSAGHSAFTGESLKIARAAGAP